MKVLFRLRGWNGLLLALLIAIVAMNVLRSPYYLGVSNIVNLFQLSIEKVIVVLSGANVTDEVMIRALKSR